MGSVRKEKEKCDYQFKLLIIGDLSVGKTALANRYTDNVFNQDTLTTIGLECKSKIIPLDGISYRLQIWDTSGQERYKAITPSYFRDASGIILVYSVIDPNSFKSIKNWSDMIKKNAPEKVVTILVGSKIDLEKERLVKKEDAQEEAKNYNFEYFEASSKDGVGTNEPFDHLFKKLVEQKIKSGEIIEKSGSLNLKKKSKDSKQTCLFG